MICKLSLFSALPCCDKHFFYHIAECISILQRAEGSCTRTFSQWSTRHSTFTEVWLLPSVLLQGYTGNGTPCSCFFLCPQEIQTVKLTPNLLLGPVWRGKSLHWTHRCSLKSSARMYTSPVFACCSPQWHEPIMGPLEQSCALTVSIPGDTIFLKFPNSCTELIKATLRLQQAALYLKYSFWWKVPWIH